MRLVAPELSSFLLGGLGGCERLYWGHHPPYSIDNLNLYMFSFGMNVCVQSFAFHMIR